MTARKRKVTAGRLVEALRALGWVEEGRSGRHVLLGHAEAPRLTVPADPHEVLTPALLREILGDAGPAVERVLRESLKGELGPGSTSGRGVRALAGLVDDAPGVACEHDRVLYERG